MFSQYVFLTALLIISLLTVPLIGQQSDRAMREAKIVAENFLIYRGAAREFIAKNPGHDGTVSSGSLDLPTGYNNLGWNSEANSGTMYVYGELEPGGLLHAANEIDGQINLGKNEGGTLVSPIHGDTGISVPGFVPSGNVVAVIRNTP